MRIRTMEVPDSRDCDRKMLMTKPVQLAATVCWALLSVSANEVHICSKD